MRSGYQASFVADASPVGGCFRCIGLSRLLLAVFFLATVAGNANATVQFGAVQLSGNLESQNIVRTPSIDKWMFIQNRNTARIRVDWDWIQDGRMVDQFDIGFIKASKFYFLYRGVYDGFYDLAPGGSQIGEGKFDDLIGGPIEGNRGGSCRDASGTLLFPCPGADPFDQGTH